MHFIAIIWHYNEITIWYNNCKGQVSTSVLSFYITVALTDYGHNYRPNHVVVNAIRI